MYKESLCHKDFIDQKPFIHLFTTPRGFYFYDVNQDSIIQITQGVYEYLSSNRTLESLSQEDRNSISRLKKEAFLAPFRVQKIRHPDMQNLEYYLNKRAEQLILQVTQSCNLSCSYCPYANKTDNVLQRNHSGKCMTWETAKKSIDFFCKHSSETQTVGISFYGGEPLLAFGLIRQSMEYAKKLFAGKDLNFHMTTNGTLFTDEIIDYFSRNVVHIAFSIDGAEAVHDLNRRHTDGTGSFHQAVSSLKRVYNAFSDEARGRLSVNMVLNPETNAEDILKLFDDPFFGEEKVSISAGLAEDDYLARKFTNSEDFVVLLEYQYFLGYLSYLGAVKNLRMPPIVRGYFANFDKLRMKYRMKSQPVPEEAAPGGPCIPGQRRLFVSTDGIFYPCERVNELSEVMKIGNINDGFDYENAGDILNFAALTPEECRRCYAFWQCKLCAAAADAVDHFSAAKKFRQCAESRSAAESEMLNCVLIREKKTFYSKKRRAVS